MFGMPTMATVAAGTNMPVNTQADTDALQKLYAAVKAQNATPNGRVSRGFNQFGPQASKPQAPMLPTPPAPAPVQMSPPVVAADDTPAPGSLSSQNWAGPHSVGGAPLPNVGPTSVGGAPLPTASPLDTAQWPAGPVGAPTNAQASDPAAVLGPAPQASGTDVIQKLMSYFKNKDNPSDG